MDKTSLLNKIKEFGLNTKEEYMTEAFSRNIGLLTQAEQDKLANVRVAIPGMGGVGGVHLTTMTRTGVGNFHIADFDVFEPANINRQYGARIHDLGRIKLGGMKEQALSINPYLEIKEFPEDVNSVAERMIITEKSFVSNTGLSHCLAFRSSYENCIE